MTAREIIAHAAHKVGLSTAEPGNMSAEVYSYGFAALNRAWRWVWSMYPYRGAKIPNLSVSTEDEVLLFPPYVDAVRSVRRSDGALFPLNDIIASDHLMPEWLDGQSPARWINMPDAPCTAQPAEVYADLEAETLAALGGTAPEGSVIALSAAVSINAPGDEAPSFKIDLRSGARMDISEGVDWSALAVAGDVDAVRLTSCAYEASITLSMSRMDGEETLASASRVWAQIYGGDRAAYRRIRLVPPPVAGIPVTLTVNALRRFRPLVDGDATLLIPEAENACFSYLVAEFREFNDEAGLASAERDKAAAELQVVIDADAGNKIEREDVSAYPESSIFSE